MWGPRGNNPRDRPFSHVTFFHLSLSLSLSPSLPPSLQHAGWTRHDLPDTSPCPFILYFIPCIRNRYVRYASSRVRTPLDRALARTVEPRTVEPQSLSVTCLSSPAPIVFPRISRAQGLLRRVAGFLGHRFHRRRLVLLQQPPAGEPDVRRHLPLARAHHRRQLSLAAFIGMLRLLLLHRDHRRDHPRLLRAHLLWPAHLVHIPLLY